MIDIQFTVANDGKHKFTAWITNGQKVRRVHFGAKGYSDFTQHKSLIRKQKYHMRHIMDHINDPYKAGFWSYWVLWNKKSLLQSFKDAKQRAIHLISGSNIYFNFI